MDEAAKDDIGADGTGMDAKREKDALLVAALPNVVFDGWSVAALRAGARDAGIDMAAASALFPRGSVDMVEWFNDWADRGMIERLAAAPLAEMKVRDRVAEGVRARLAILAPHREAARRGLAVLAQPQHAPLALNLVYRTVDAIWYAAGDTATDYNFYTKRALLAAVYGATMLCWLEDRSPDGAVTAAFLRRRLDEAMALPKITERLRAAADRLPNPLRFLRAAQRR
jgi:ubiquinone biosynthesis protein COQ9